MSKSSPRSSKRQRGGLRKRKTWQALVAAKIDYLNAFQERLDYLSILAKDGRMFEATILASCYLGALSRLRYQNTQKEDQQSYVKFLLGYGRDGDLTRVSLPILESNLHSFLNSETSALLAWIHARTAQKKFLSSIQMILRGFRRDFRKPEEFVKVIRKSTVAGIIYTHVRSRGVHEASSLAENRSIELGNGAIVITGRRIIDLAMATFTNVRPYLERTHRWARYGRYA